MALWINFHSVVVSSERKGAREGERKAGRDAGRETEREGETQGLIANVKYVSKSRGG